MPFLAYVAIILVSLGGILFELNWLTSPKLETKPAVQASASAPQPKVAAATTAQANELKEDVTEPKADAPAGPRNVAPSVTMVPGDALAAKPAQTAEAAPTPAPTPMTATPPSKTTQPQSAEPQQTATAPVMPPADATATAALRPVETTGVGSTDFKREFTNDAKPVETNGSSATFAPALATTAAGGKCDIAACSATYQSFRASDCSYQPFDGGARKTCDRAEGGAQQAAAPQREHKVENTARNESSRKPNKEAGLRAFEREVRRITASEANLDPGYERGGRSQVIVIDRRDW